MKKLMIVLMAILVAGLLSASIIAPSEKTISGILRYERTNICGISDFIRPIEAGYAGSKVYLLGDSFPTLGKYQGCMIKADGYPGIVGACNVLYVKSSTITCPTSVSVPATRQVSP